MTDAQAQPAEHRANAWEMPLMYGLVGLVVGIGLFVLVRLEDIGASGYWSAPVAVALLAFGSAAMFAGEQRRRLVSIALALGLAGLLGGLSLWYVHTVRVGDVLVDHGWFVVFCGNALIALIAIPFFRTTAVRGLSPTTYTSLFEVAWNTVVIGFLAGIFAWIAYGVVAAASGLLAVVGIEYFIDHVIGEDWFSWSFWFTAFGVAVGVIRNQERIILAVRSIVFVLLRVIGPIPLVASIVFIGVFALSGFDAFDDNLSAAGVIIGIVLGGVVHLNAILGDGADNESKGRLSRTIARVQGVVLPILMIIAAVAIWLRVGQYGWTPARFHAALIATVGAGYALVYAIGAVLPRGFGVIRNANIALAGVAALIAALVQTPILQAETISANSQVNRILAQMQAGAEDIESDDLIDLRWEMGAPGVRALERFKVSAQEAGEAGLVARSEGVLEAESRYSSRRAAEKGAPDGRPMEEIDLEEIFMEHIALPPGQVWPESFLDEWVRNERPSYESWRWSAFDDMKSDLVGCHRDGPTEAASSDRLCAGVIVEGTPTSAPRIFLVGADGRGWVHWVLRDGVWRDNVVSRTGDERIGEEAWARALAAGDYVVEMRSFPVLVVDGEAYYALPTLTEIQDEVITQEDTPSTPDVGPAPSPSPSPTPIAPDPEADPN